MTSTFYDIIGLEEVEKNRGLVSFEVKPEEHKIELTIKEPVKKKAPADTIVYDRGRKRKEKGKLF